MRVRLPPCPPKKRVKKDVKNDDALPRRTDVRQDGDHRSMNRETVRGVLECLRVQREVQEGEGHVLSSLRDDLPAHATGEEGRVSNR